VSVSAATRALASHEQRQVRGGSRARMQADIVQTMPDDSTRDIQEVQNGKTERQPQILEDIIDTLGWTTGFGC